jgi:hypothetical protein
MVGQTVSSELWVSEIDSGEKGKEFELIGEGKHEFFMNLNNGNNFVSR